VALIGKRPYEEKRVLDVTDHDSNGVPPAVVVPPATVDVK
jgi:hypothetical protein